MRVRVFPLVRGVTRASAPIALLTWFAACGPAPDGERPRGDDDDTPPVTDSSAEDACDPPCDAATEVCVDQACVTCAPEVVVPHAIVAGAPIGVAHDPVAGPFEERRFLMRPVQVAGAGVVAVDGAIEIYGEDGALVAPGSTVAETTLYVRGLAPGEATLTLRPTDACGAGEDVVLPFRVARSTDLAGRELTGYPHFEPVRAVNAAEALQTAMDPHVHADRVGASFDVYVVAHKTPAEWAADPSLVDVGDGASGVVTGGSIADNVVDAWAVVGAGTEITTPHDVVYDFDGDGELDPGDLIDGFDAPGFDAVIDLTTAGPHVTARFEYSTSFWNTMVVYAPDPPVGNHPLVVISHGNGHEYTWYDYLGEHLASWGYVVISHRNDTMPGPITAAVTTFTNTEAFLAGLPTMGGGVLAGMVDDTRISWIGHSRGGEGVVIAYDKIFDGAVSPQNFGVSDIVLVSSIAPTLFEGPDVANPNTVPYHILAGAADGDVTGGVDCDLCQYFRIFQRGTGPLLATYVQGATHNDFNCCGVADGEWIDADGPLIGRMRAQQVAKSYYLALLERYVRGDVALEDYLARMPEGFRPVSANAVIATQFKAAAAADKLVVDDFQANPDPALSSSGGLVTWTVENLVEGAMDDANTSLQWQPSDPMNGMSQSDADGAPARGIVFDYPDGSDLQLEFEVLDRDVSRFGHLSLRACQGTRHPYTAALGDLLSFTVALVDGDGVESAVDFGVYGRLTAPYDRDDGAPGSGWINEFQTVRIPLDAFVADGAGLDLTDIAAVRLRFGAAHGSAQGRVGLDDLEFTE